MEKSHRSRKVIIAAASLVAIGACKADSKAELAPKVKGYIAAVTDLEACIATVPNPDFLTSVAFGRASTSVGSTGWLEKCQVTFEDRMAAFEDTAKRLGVKTSFVEPDLHDLHHTMQLRKLCDWVSRMHGDLDALAKATHQTAPANPSCSFGDASKRWPPLLEAVGKSTNPVARAEPEVSLRASTPATLDQLMAFYRSTDPASKSVIGASRDGKTIDTIEVPSTAVAVAPAPKGFVALVRPTAKGPVELQVHDGTEASAWKKAGTLPARDYTQVHASANLITAVSSPTGQPTLVEVQRSTDGGKTFGAPIRVRDNKGNLWSDVRIERDGAVVALGATASGFSAVRLEPAGKQPLQVQVPFKEPVKDATLALCRGTSTYWVLADQRWLLGSNDAGKSWRDVDLGASTTPRALYCVADQVLVTRPLEPGMELVVCGPTACKPPATVDRTNVQLLFARAIGADLELWFEDLSSPGAFESDGPLVWVYTWKNGVLTPDRFHLLPTQRNMGMRVMLTNLDNTIGWLDPRSGLGEQPWRNGSESR